jgi:rRNA large subunit m3Psi methyltransferase RlmH
MKGIETLLALSANAIEGVSGAGWGENRAAWLGGQVAANISWQDSGTREVRFLIGAADGHDPATRADADLLLGFGRATWPHMLVRGMLAEQLYRATTIIAGHPYHRA